MSAGSEAVVFGVDDIPDAPSFDGGRLLAAARAHEAEALERVARLRRLAQEKAQAAAARGGDEEELALDAIEVVDDEVPRKPAAAPPPVPSLPRRARPRLPGLPPTQPPTNRPIVARGPTASAFMTARFAAFETSDES